MAMENGSLISDVPIKASMYRAFSSQPCLITRGYEPTQITGGNHFPTHPCAVPPRGVSRSYVDILNAYLERNLRSNGGVLDGVIFAMVKYTMEDRILKEVCWAGRKRGNLDLGSFHLSHDRRCI